MATNKAIKFYSKAYEATGANSAKTFSTNNAGAIVFDKTTHSIYVGGNQYGGSNLVDATFSSGVLTITKRTGDPVQLDFSSLATTENVMNAFKQLHDEIDAIEGGAGLGEGGTYTADSTTNYLTGATSLKDADKKLDTKVKDIEDSLFNVTDFNYISNGTSTGIRTVEDGGKLKVVIDTTDAVGSGNPLTTKTYVDSKVAALDGTATIASKSGNVVTLKAGLTETDGVVSNNSDTDIVLEEVATTGAAADVSIADTGNKITATTVEGALTELADRITNKNVSVDSNEKILAVTNNVLSTTLSVAIEKQGESGNQKDYIVLKGIGGAEISKVDATAFVKDGMLSSAELVTEAETGDNIPETPYIKLTWNTDAGSTVTRFSVKSLVDTYTSGDENTLTVSGYTITPKTAAVAENGTALTTGGQVYTAIAATKGQDIQTITGETATSQGDYVNVKVTATKGANDNNYTLSTTSNVTTHAVSTATTGTGNDGLATALDVKTYVDAQVDTAIQSVDGSSTEKAKTVTASDYATVKVSATTDSSKNVTLDSAIGLTIQGVSGASTNAMGLAEASDVKTYVDTKANVVNKSATIPVNSATATTLATVGGTAITAQASFEWEEYS